MINKTTEITEATEREQLSFLNDFGPDIVDNLFKEYYDRMIIWQGFQDKNKTAGNDFYWWRSRFSEDYPGFENQSKQNLFSFLWDRYTDVMQRNCCGR